jgi:hypothetical protein
VIRDAVLHILNEQPLLVDLFERPSPADVALLCTNVRTTAGQRPSFVDHSDSTFLIPYAQIRFVEVAAVTSSRPHPEGASDAADGGGAAGGPDSSEPDLDLDEDFLRRVRDA